MCSMKQSFEQFEVASAGICFSQGLAIDLVALDNFQLSPHCLEQCFELRPS